jgi:hypothetical protein
MAFLKALTEWAHQKALLSKHTPSAVPVQATQADSTGTQARIAAIVVDTINMTQWVIVPQQII